MKYLAFFLFLSLTCRAETDYSYAINKTAEATYKYFHLETMFAELEEQVVPKKLRKYVGVVSITKAIMEKRIDYTFNF